MGAAGVRTAFLAVFACSFLLQAGASWAQSSLVYVSREQVLREIEAVERLTEIEEQMAAQLQASVSAVETQLAAEESELARLRPDLDTDEFRLRAQDFDRRVRAVRRETQERAAFVKRGFAEAKNTIIEALPGVIEEVRQRQGALIIVDRDMILAADPRLDLTEEVIALFNEKGPRPPAPKIDLTRPLLPAPSAQAAEDGQSAQ